MPVLDKHNQDRAEVHLGYSYGVPAQDWAQLYEAFNTIRSDYLLKEIIYQLDVCEMSRLQSRLGDQAQVRYSQREEYSGDINRGIRRENIADIRIWQEAYRDDCEELARLLHVPNYRAVGAERYKFARSGAEYIMAIPGVADTSVSSRKLEFAQLGGGFGF